MRVGDVLLEDKKIFIRSKVSKNKKSQYVAIPEAFLPALKGLSERSTRELIFPGTGKWERKLAR